jgi:hypothetical protein
MASSTSQSCAGISSSDSRQNNEISFAPSLLADKAYAGKLSELAEHLDEKDFNIAEVESQVSAEEFSWLKSHIGKTKIALRGKFV